MSSLKDMSPEELAALVGDGTPDLPPASSNSIMLLQPNSPQLSSSSDSYAEGAAAGDFLSYAQGRPIVIDGSSGFNFVPIGFELSWPEFAPNRGGFVTNHPEKPASAVWLPAHKSPDNKAGLFLPNGNRCEQTITVFMMIIPDEEDRESVEPYPAVFSFRSSSLAVGRELANRASRAKVTINGVEITGPTICMWRLASRSEVRGPHRWQTPFCVPAGKLGEARGPTIEIARMAKKLRDDFKTGAVKLRSDAKPALTGPANDDDKGSGGAGGGLEADAGGSLFGGNGFGPPAPPPASYDGPDDDYTF